MKKKIEERDDKIEFIKPKEKKDKERKIFVPRRTFSFLSFVYLVIFTFVAVSLVSSLVYHYTPKIAVIKIDGPIMTESGSTIYGSAVSSRYVSDILKKLMKDKSVKGIILDINSPGGSPVASAEISKMVDKVKKVKPVYAVIEDLGASGAYWVAVSANKIYASPMSIVGSIGVTSAGLSFQNFIKRFNITYRRLVAGKYKDIGTIYRNMTPQEREILQNLLNNIYYDFIKHVATERNLSFQYVKAHANGMIYLGSQAKNISFVDKLGYYEDAVNDMKNATDNNSIVVIYSQEKDILSMFGLETFFSKLPTAMLMY